MAAKVKRCPRCTRLFMGEGKYCTSECSSAVVAETCKQLREKEGPIYEKWRARLKASIERL